MSPLMEATRRAAARYPIPAAHRSTDERHRSTDGPDGAKARAKGWSAVMAVANAMQLCSGAVGIAVGLWLLNPAWDTFHSGPTYTAFANSGLPEWFVGTVIVGGAGGQLAAWFAGHRIWQILTALGALATWTLIGVSAYYSSPPALLCPIALVTAAFQFLAAWRLAGRPE